jgi:sarcosine oxidase
MDSSIDFDVIIVGLGCVGLSTAYYCSKQGLRVLGLERYSNSGSLGSGSAGYGRIWRYMHTEDRFAKMQEEAMEIWRELEHSTGKSIL